MRTKTPLRCVAVAATFALLTAACGGGGTGGGTGGTGDQGGVQGGTVTAQLTEPSGLAPAQVCYESECSKVLNLVNDPLLSIDMASGELVYDGLLESIETTDNQTFTLSIKPGMKFHNGEPVDSDAFIRAWNYSADPANATDTTGFLSKIEGYGEGKELAGLQKVDNLTFRVTLADPFRLFPTVLTYSNAFAPVAQECFNNLNKCNESPIGTGPYQMQGVWQHSQQITLTRWPGYQGEQTANPDTIEFQMTTDLVSAWRAMQAGQIDVTRLDPTIFQEAQATLGDRVLTPDSGEITYMGFPTKSEPWDDPRMRQAISMAFNRQQIIDKVLNGLYTPLTAIAPPAIPGSQEGVCDYCEYDPQRAKQLFQQAGGQPGMTINLWFNAGSGHEGWVEAIGHQLEQNLGVNFKLQGREWAQFLEVLENNSFTGPFRLGWLPDYPAAENYLRPIVATGGDSNYTGYSNPQVDSLLAKGDQADSAAEADQFYHQAEAVALQDMPILPLWVANPPYGYSDDVQNVHYNLMNEIELNEVVVTQ
jgi:oligopeptide transport system substrate-binding protein